MKIREATVADIEGIAYVHAESWKTTYRGLISEGFLNQITVEGRSKLWHRNFESPNKDEVMYVAEAETGKIIGFANGGICREADSNYDAELYAIYLLREQQGNGIGKLLLRSVVQNLAMKNYNSLMTWVIDGNPALNFYHKMGGESVARKEVKIGDGVVEEIMIGWRNKKVL